MQKVILTCVACGKTKTVDDDSESKRNQTCKCGQPMIEKRSPGSSKETV